MTFCKNSIRISCQIIFVNKHWPQSCLCPFNMYHIIFQAVFGVQLHKAMAGRTVRVVKLSRLSFNEAYNVQRKYAADVKTGTNMLLLLEHTPVYTTGIRDNPQLSTWNLWKAGTPGFVSEEMATRLRGLGADFVRTNRGGLVTFHGPGQLVAYPILNLKDFTPSVRWYICALQKTMIRMCKHYGLQAKSTEHTGVWIEDRKIGAIGENLPSCVVYREYSVGYLLIKGRNKCLDLATVKHLLFA